ncbi:hypothetical protein OVY29_05295 [Sphingopyxis sp. SE2]|uniref:hypothetical protein n=1 Tax=Sphingopyxis sp. SE2 TaxID=1586240 RepID=UPI0028C30858|nr:hypothetical protein [Sphingopyxis sp. SE2]MDT7528074.1 hypothetical protein [Sphingopyxis sp. SE2]
MTMALALLTSRRGAAACAAAPIRLALAPIEASLAMLPARAGIYENDNEQM